MDIFDRYLDGINPDWNQDEIKAYDRSFNLREGVGCPACGGVWEAHLVADERGYYRRCADCGELQERKEVRH
jgi:translation initiation factor 2 beta subunit (eIF-2beta)/eIF-5